MNTLHTKRGIATCGTRTLADNRKPKIYDNNGKGGNTIAYNTSLPTPAGTLLSVAAPGGGNNCTNPHSQGTRKIA